MLEQLIAEDRLEPVFQLACDRAHDWALGSQGLIDRIIDEDVGPSWKPKFVNSLLGDRVYRELVDFTYKVRADPGIRCGARCTPLCADSPTTCSDPEMIARFENIKNELLGRDEVGNAASTAWKTGKAVIEQMLEDPNQHVAELTVGGRRRCWVSGSATTSLCRRR